MQYWYLHLSASIPAPPLEEVYPWNSSRFAKRGLELQEEVLMLQIVGFC